MFPASCPYVTAVGGTRDFPPHEIPTWDETNSYVSGGGLSDYFPRPAYQDAVVEKYLSEIGNLHEGLYNRTGRAYPDLAAQGYRYQIVYAGMKFFFGGTSAASPTVAGSTYPVPNYPHSSSLSWLTMNGGSFDKRQRRPPRRRETTPWLPQPVVV